MVTAIQPITNFSMILPATSVSPAEVVTVASDFVATPTSSTIVTLGESQPASQPLFDSSGNLVPPGTQAQTPQSQALANELTAVLNASSASANNVTASLDISTLFATGTTTGNTNPATLLELNLLNAAGLSGAGLANSASLTDFSGILGANVELAIAGIGTAGGGTAANALNVAATNAVLTAPTATTTTATATLAIAPTATAPAATVPAAVAPTVTAPVAVAPTATAPAASVPAATVPIATAPPATTTPTATTAAAAVTIAAPVGLTPADVLRQLIADVNGRALANLTDAGFASTSAGLFVGAAIFRAANNVTITTIGTADIAGTPPGAVTALQPTRAV